MYYEGDAFNLGHGILSPSFSKTKATMILLTILIINALMWAKEIVTWKSYKQF